MKKIAITLAAIATLTATAAQADYRYRGHAPAPRYEHHRGPNWVAPVIGGLLLGGAIYGAHRYYQPTCWTEMVGYDYYGREVYRRICQ
mgnify:CR=1 FL=1